jgi:uncharacterized protein YkwD
VFRPLLALVVVAAAIVLGYSASAGAGVNARVADREVEQQFVQDLFAEINALRASHSLHALRVGPALRRAACQHDREMGRLGYFSHDSANGTDFTDRLERFYPSGSARFWMVGENLLWSGGNLTVRGAVRVWLRSPMHRANLLRRDWRQIGISAMRVRSAPGYFRHRHIWLVTTDFGVRY